MSLYHWLGAEAEQHITVKDDYGATHYVHTAKIDGNRIEVTTVNDAVRQFIYAFPAA